MWGICRLTKGEDRVLVGQLEFIGHTGVQQYRMRKEPSIWCP